MSTSTFQDGQPWLEKLLSLMGLQTRVAAQQLSETHQWLEIDSQPLGADAAQNLLGKDGVILDSLQFLINTHLNLSAIEGQESAYTVELLGHRAQRHTELLAMAQKAIEAVKSTGQEYVFEPLRASERRQLHLMLSTEEGLHTYSRGKEPERYLVLSPQAEETVSAPILNVDETPS